MSGLQWFAVALLALALVTVVATAVVLRDTERTLREAMAHLAEAGRRNEDTDRLNADTTWLIEETARLRKLQMAGATATIGASAEAESSTCAVRPSDRPSDAT